MGDGWGFLRTSRWIGLIAGALVVSAVCVLLGAWQWGRYEQRAAAVERVDRNWEAGAVAPDDVVAGGLRVPADLEWQRVELHGRWVPGSTVLLRNRPVAGTPALHVLAVFEARRAAGPPIALVVSRGWVPVDDAAPPLPAGDRAIVARLGGGEGPVVRTPPPGPVFSLHGAQVLSAADTDAVARLADVPVVQGWAQDTAPEPPLRGFPEPARDLGSHLSYAFQWWFFAAATPVGVAILARRERIEGPAGTPGPRVRRRMSDEIAEDALIDAQLHG